jgi:putative transcriptional regulator
MPTVERSKRPLKALKKKSRRAGKTSLAAGLREGIEQAAKHFRGGRQMTAYEYRVPGHIDVRALREKSGLSQAKFAARYALNPRTVQEWEQGRAQPDVAVRAYLTVIRANPRAVEKALAGEP